MLWLLTENGELDGGTGRAPHPIAGRADVDTLVLTGHGGQHQTLAVLHHVATAEWCSTLQQTGIFQSQKYFIVSFLTSFVQWMSGGGLPAALHLSSICLPFFTTKLPSGGSAWMLGGTRQRQEILINSLLIAQLAMVMCHGCIIAVDNTD